MVQLSEAKNKVESLIYSIKDWLTTTRNTEFMKDEEYSNLTTMIADAQDKFENYPQLFDINTSKNISKKISEYFNVIKKRSKDYYNFNDTIYLAHQLINSTLKEIGILISERPWINEDNLKSISEEISKFNLTISEAQINFPNYNKSSNTLFNREIVNRQKESFNSLIAILRYIEKPKSEKKNNTKPLINFTKEKDNIIDEEEINLEDDSQEKNNKNESNESKGNNENHNEETNESTNSENQHFSNNNQSGNVENNFSSKGNDL